MVTIGGQIFSAEILTRINQTVETDPVLSRRKLSIQVCEWLGWRNPAGRWQEMSCRKAMLALYRQGLIALPKVQKVYPFQKTHPPPAPPPLAVVESSLDQLGKIELIRVAHQSLSEIWRGMMDAYHYLKSGPLCGAQIRYLIRSQSYGWVGGLSYSASAWHVECRDQWIGWTEEARRLNQNFLVNNSRFLIPPMVKVKNLASFVLALSQARLADDWEEVYHYRPVLLETYVERGRFAGSCYRGANWKFVGQTGGRGRQGIGASIKDVYLMPLTPAWQAALCRQRNGQVQVRTQVKAAPKDWIEAELGGANLGDRRLTARLLQITGQFFSKPLANIPEACGSLTAANGTYRFLDNERITWQAILDPHYRATEERVKNEKLVLVAQDTTTLNYSSHPHTQGLGPIGSGNEKHQGLIVHDTVAFTPQGTPLGLLNVQCWAREGSGHRHERHEKPIEEKESWKWVESFQAAATVQKHCRRTHLVILGDREADIYELFAEQAQNGHGADLVIRAERSRNRQVIMGEEESEYLWPLLEGAPLLGTRELLVPPSEKRQARTAILEVRSRKVKLKPPRRKRELPLIAVWAVLAREIEVPEGVEGLEWMLLTTVKTKEKEDAYQRLDWYARRWGIEVYHRILKSGCRVEKRQLEQARRLQNCLAIDMVVAWRIHYLTYLGKEAPDVPCTICFTDSEWKALTTFVNKTRMPPEVPPTLNEAVHLLGRLGGYLGRSGDGHPGSEVLWRGMARLTDIEGAYVIYH
jgi:hypothetical protein